MSKRRFFFLLYITFRESKQATDRLDSIFVWHAPSLNLSCKMLLNQRNSRWIRQVNRHCIEECAVSNNVVIFFFYLFVASLRNRLKIAFFLCPLLVPIFSTRQKLLVVIFIYCSCVSTATNTSTRINCLLKYSFN